MISTTVVCSYE